MVVLPFGACHRSCIRIAILHPGWRECRCNPLAIVQIFSSSQFLLRLCSDSTDLYKANDFVALRQRLATDGFLFIRGLIPRETAISARRTILEHIQQKGAIRSGTKLMDAQMADNASAHAGWTVDAESGGVVGNRDPDKDPHIGWSVVGNSKEVTAVYNGEALNGFYSKLFAKAEDVRALPHCT